MNEKNLMNEKLNEKLKEKFIEPTPLIVRTEVMKIRNSGSRYLKIPDDSFRQIEHGHECAVLEQETDEQVFVVFAFNKTLINGKLKQIGEEDGDTQKD
jgi:hypothetical protein